MPSIYSEKNDKKNMVVVSVVEVKKLKLVNYKKIIIQTPSVVDEQEEIILLLQGSSNLSVHEISLSLRDLQGRAWLCFTQVCAVGRGTVIIRHSGTFQLFRDQCCNDHMTIHVVV